MSTIETAKRVSKYIETWQDRCYSSGIPEEVPSELAARGLAPSYKAIAIALLKNDMHLRVLGFSSRKSDWYGVLKREELKKETLVQLRLF
jgi:predicted phosphoadenosine phosphosulfate sulfurtransferase